MESRDQCTVFGPADEGLLVHCLKKNRFDLMPRVLKIDGNVQIGRSESCPQGAICRISQLFGHLSLMHTKIEM